VTSLCFGGPNRDTFLVTTAGGKPGGNSADGSIYQWQAGTRGPAEFRSRIDRPTR
jgi:sugar lactone lactonase YvrE